MTTYIKFLLFLAFYLLSPDIFAGVFDVVPTDKSKEYLGIIFGGSIGAVSLGGGGNPMLSKMFERFNFIIVTAGVLIVSYIGVVAAINTAREGEAMGKKFSLWVPLRGLFGMLTMLPSPGTGYSIIQMTVMWIVLNGIGAANAVWNVVLDQLASGVRAVGAIDIPNMKTDIDIRTNNILLMATCQNVLNTLNIDLTKNYGPIKLNVITEPVKPITYEGNDLTTTKDDKDTRPQPIKDLTGKTLVEVGGIQGYTQIAHIRVGVESNQNTSSRSLDKICGEVTVETTVLYNNPNFSPAGTENRTQIKLNAVKAIFDTVSAAADTLSPPPPTSPFEPEPKGPPGTFQSAYNNYIAQISQLVTAAARNLREEADPNAAIAAQVNTFKSFGWIHAGGYYFSMTSGSSGNAEENIIKALPTASGNPTYTSVTNPAVAPTGGFSGELNTQLQNDANRIKLNSALGRAQNFANGDMGYTTPGLPVLGSSYPSSGDKTLDKVIKVVLQGIRDPIFKFFSTELTKKLEDPLISIGKFGTGLMYAGEITTFSMIILSSVTMWAVSAGSCLSPLPFGFNMLLLQIFPALMGAIVLLWTAGATLGIYVPMIPYLVFTATAIGWMIAVIEAVVGAPIIAIALVQPSGEELGNIKAALGILATIFLKPILMIFGFVIAGSLLRAILTMINFGFVSALSVAIPSPTFFSIVPTLTLYVFLIIAVVNQSFSLIHVLPSKVLRFAGVSPEDGSPEKIMSETKGGFETGSKAAHDVQKGAVDSAKEKYGAASKVDKGKKKGDGQELPKPVSKT